MKYNGPFKDSKWHICPCFPDYVLGYRIRRRGPYISSAMAGVLTVTASSIGVNVRLLPLRRSLYATETLRSSLSPSRRCSITGWNPLQRRTSVLPSRKLVIRAARTESKGVTLGFRAPDFEVCCARVCWGVCRWVLRSLLFSKTGIGRVSCL